MATDQHPFDDYANEDDEYRRRTLHDQLAPLQSPQGAAQATSQTPAPAPVGQGTAPGTSRDQALQQVQDSYKKHSGTFGADQLNDFNNVWNQSAEAGLYTGPGYGKSFADLLPSHERQIQQRWQGPGEQAQQEGTSQYTGGGSSGGSTGLDSGALSALQALLAQMQSRDAQQQQERGGLREILMSQLAGFQKPVSVNDPGIREVLSGQRIGLQRGLERGRANAAEQRAYEGYGTNSDQLRYDVERMNEGAAETEAGFTGQVLHQELQQRRQGLQQMLSQAMAIGDSESARSVAAQLEAIKVQLGQSNFYDQSAYQYAGLNQNANLSALMAMLGAG